MVVVKKDARSIGDPFRISQAFLDALDARVVELIEEAKQRAEANGRKTLQPQDL